MAKTGAKSEAFVSPREVAKHFGFGRDVTYNLLYEGRIKSVRIGRRFFIPRSELEDFPQRESNGDIAHVG